MRHPGLEQVRGGTDMNPQATSVAALIFYITGSIWFVVELAGKLGS